MTIKVRKVSGNYFSVYARTTLADGSDEWSPTEPMEEKSLVEELMRRGFHIQDIVDAMVEADPTWLERQKNGNQAAGSI